MKLELRSDMRAFERRVDELFREAWGGRMPTLWPASFGRLRRSFSPSSDVFKRGDDLVARIELPGIDPERDLTVEVRDGELVVRGSRHGSEEVKEDDYYRKEVWQGSYERHLPLPEGTADDAVSGRQGHPRGYGPRREPGNRGAADPCGQDHSGDNPLVGKTGREVRRTGPHPAGWGPVRLLTCLSGQVGGPTGGRPHGPDRANGVAG